MSFNIEWVMAMDDTLVNSFKLHELQDYLKILNRSVMFFFLALKISGGGGDCPPPPTPRCVRPYW